MTPELAHELADCVARNEGLIDSIRARGLPLKETLSALVGYRGLFYEASERKRELLRGANG